MHSTLFVQYRKIRIDIVSSPFSISLKVTNQLCFYRIVMIAESLAGKDVLDYQAQPLNTTMSMKLYHKLLHLLAP